MDGRIFNLLVESFPKMLVPCLKMTIPLTLISFGCSLVIALVLALVQVAEIPGLKQLARLYIWIFRGTPQIVQLYIIFYGLPSIGVMIDALPASIIALSLNAGAYNAETLRASIQAIPKGQTEAGYLTGLNFLQIMRKIVLPQASRIAFPQLFNSLISLVKTSSLASSVTVIEMFSVAKKIAGITFEPFILYCEAAVIYLMVCTILTFVQDVCEKRLNIAWS